MTQNSQKKFMSFTEQNLSRPNRTYSELDMFQSRSIPRIYCRYFVVCISNFFTKTYLGTYVLTPSPGAVALKRQQRAILSFGLSNQPTRLKIRPKSSYSNQSESNWSLPNRTEPTNLLETLFR